MGGSSRLARRVRSLDEQLARFRFRVAQNRREALDRWRSHAGALQFHLGDSGDHPLLVAVLGGTGTGKSTVVNRLVEADVTAASFRRTFTSGPVAVAAGHASLPDGWLDQPLVPAAPQAVPVRGQAGALTLVSLAHTLTEKVTIIDTPDLDGDRLDHHAEADCVFRWSQAVLFLVTPEKYQMTELTGYYRLARRYGLASLFVMNKCEEPAVVEDFAESLRERDWPDARVFAVPREDAAYAPSPERSLPGLRDALCGGARPAGAPWERALANRTHDLMNRFRDQVLAPLREDRVQIERLRSALASLRTTVTGVDVSPLTQQLQRRMQEQSVLYLMGPGRVLERVRQLPTILARLPRTAWDLVARGQRPELSLPSARAEAPPALDFHGMLVDQFIVVQSRIDDVLRSSKAAGPWLVDAGESYEATRIDPAEAGRIAEQELADLKRWLDERWERAPRDTRAVERLLSCLPGGRRVVRISEAAPYLLALVVATHGALFGPIDLLIIGGFSAATWLSEKLSNEVSRRARQTNRRIRDRFEQLAADQVERVRRWLDEQAPPAAALADAERTADEIFEHAGTPARETQARRGEPDNPD